MKKLFSFVLVVLLGLTLKSQEFVENNYKDSFKKAYEKTKYIPKGILEAVSYTYTRFSHINENYMESPTGMPRFWTIMGLVEDGKGYFRENLKIVSELSGYSIEEIKKNPEIAILAYAIALDKIFEKNKLKSSKLEDISFALLQLSEIPFDNTNKANQFAFESYLYQVLSLMNEEEFASANNFEAKNYDLKQFFGEDYEIYRSKHVYITDEGVFDEYGNEYKGTLATCPDYNVSNCNWIASPNYSSRNGTAISAIVMHTVQGSYSSCISWFQNTSAQASAHYVLRSSDGQICQMVREANKAWHIGSENPYTVGYEHEGYIEQTGWYTTAMYQSSAGITRSVASKYGINTKRTFHRETLENGTQLDNGINVLAGANYCTKIAGHQHFPNQTHTDPGKYWDWEYYYKLVNQGVGEKVTYTAASGTFTDSGGENANYGNDERKFWLIKPTGATKITLTFNSFDLEDNYDYILIYDGETEFSRLIGKYSVNNPGTVQSTGGALLIEFRSDCATTAPGWKASWTSQGADQTPPTTSITGPSSANDDFNVTFADADNQGISKAYYSVMYKNSSNEYVSNSTNGFFTDYFDLTTINSQWSIGSGVWSIQSGNLVQTDEANTNTNIYAYLNQTLSNEYVYHFRAKVSGTSTDKRFGFHFFCDNGTLSNRGNSYFIWFRLSSNTLEFYKVDNNTFTLKYSVNNVVITPDTYYDFKITYDRTTGLTRVYVNNVLKGQYTYSPAHNMTIGKYISFRTANAKLYVDFIRVLRSRNTNATLTIKVGTGTTDDIKLTSTFLNTTARVLSLARDLSNNLSTFAAKDVTINFTGTKTDLANTTYAYKVYPNPFCEKINIEGSADKITIIDAKGSIIEQIEGPSFYTQINAAELPNGIYLLIIQKDDYIEKIKLIK